MSGPDGGNGQWGCPKHRDQYLRITGPLRVRKGKLVPTVRCFVENCDWHTVGTADYARRLPVGNWP